MKNFYLSMLLLAGAAAPAAAGPRTYADAQNDLGWLSRDAAAYRDNLRRGIQQQTANLETMRRLEQAKIKVEEMIQRDNAAKACKVVEYGFTAATLGAGGLAAATAEGASALTAEGAKIAARYIGKGVLTEAGKEAAGVPGYSDAVKAGTFVFNKYDENELKAQLSKDDIDVLLKAKALIEDESDGRSLKDKLPELRQMVFDMQDKLDRTAAGIKASDSLIQKTLADAAKISAEAARLKEAEDKKEREAYEAARLAKPAGLVQPAETAPAAVPPPAAAPDETAEQKRRRMQEAIYKYVQGLRSQFDAGGARAEAAFRAVKDPAAGTHYYVSGDVEDMYASLNALEEQLGGPRTYSAMQSLEETARGRGDWLRRYRQDLERYKNEIKAGVEPVIKDLAGTTGRWNSVYRTYKPQGYDVPEPPELEKSLPWTSYYEGPIAFAERTRAATEGLPEKFEALASRAAAQKDAVYADAKAWLDGYAAEDKAFKAEEPQAAAGVRAAVEDFMKKSEAVTGLPGEFVNEFSYNGKRDLSDLEPKIAAAKRAFSGAQAAYRAAADRYYSLKDRLDRLQELARSPLMDEAQFISYGSNNAAHKAAMAAALKALQEDGAPQLKGLEGMESFLPTALNGLSDTVFAADGALRYLRDAEKRMLAAEDAGLAALKANLAGDLSYLKTAGDAAYGEAVQKLFKPSAEAEEKVRGIQDEVKATFLFDPAEPLAPQKLTIRSTQYGPMVEGKQPLLFQTGFWPAAVAAKFGRFEKVSAEFWASAEGRGISEARRQKELQAAQDKRDPGAAAVKKMYEDFARAYESRDAGRVTAFIADDWTAGDGTSASDLDEQFRNIFRVYDEIRVTISGLNVVNDAPGLYAVSYNMNIRSRIFSRNIKREENSSVYEHVAVEGGRARIKKTEAGGYWEIK